MKRITVTALLVLVIPVALHAEEPAETHVKKAAEHWARMEITEAAAEWRKALEADPQNPAARAALAKLEPVFERTDAFLAVLEELVQKGHYAAARDALFRWHAPYASQDQRARVLVLKGRLSLAAGKAGEAVTSFAAAESAAASKELTMAARLGRSRALLASAGTRAEGARALEGLAKETAGTKLAAEVSWQLIAARALSGPDRIAALREFLAAFPASPRAAKARVALAAALEEDGERTTRESLAEIIAAFSAAGDAADRRVASEMLHQRIAALDEAATLEWLSGELAELPPAWEVACGPGELDALIQRRLAATNRGAEALAAAKAFQRAARKLLAEGPRDARRPRWRALEAEGMLMEGQLLLLAENELEAIAALSKASVRYRALLEEGQTRVSTVLLRIGRMLESRGRPDAAANHYRLVAAASEGERLGADSLWRLAVVYRDRLDRPLEAIEMLKRYHDLYPPSFRVPTSAAERVRKLGHADIASFQAAHGLKVDGVIGAQTLSSLRAEEENFREVLPGKAARRSVHGRLVHDVVYRLAADLEARGRFGEAARAYAAFLSMYPGHRLGDDALLAVARIFRRNDLYSEAAAAYDRLMADYPKGDRTSHAYLEAAFCRECLGEWEKAKELYDLFVKKFPHYRRSGEARRKLAAIKKLIRYTDLVKEPGLADAKMANALYETGRILYKEVQNLPKAVELFATVAEKYKKTYHGPDALFSAGTCHLHEQNFDAAREAYGRLVAEHPASRLADDAQYWIGHTHEYQARALGKLGYWRIVLRKRSAEEAAKLRADIELRRRFDPKADAPAVAWHRPHPDIIRAGRTREKVREGLHAAVAAYRKVVADHRLGDMAQKALLRVGTIYSDYLKDPDRAIEAYRELLEKYPGSKAAVDAQFAVGRHYLEKKDYGSAEKAITLFLSSFPNHPKAADALIELAECHRGRKEWVKALDDYQSFLARYPHDRRARRIREEIEWLKKYRF